MNLWDVQLKPDSGARYQAGVEKRFQAEKEPRKHWTRTGIQHLEEVGQSIIVPWVKGKTHMAHYQRVKANCQWYTRNHGLVFDVDLDTAGVKVTRTA